MVETAPGPHKEDNRRATVTAATVGCTAAGSPTAQLAWIAEKFKERTGPLHELPQSTPSTGARLLVDVSISNVVHWSEFDRGGHFAAMEASALFVHDVLTFVRLVR